MNANEGAQPKSGTRRDMVRSRLIEAAANLLAESPPTEVTARQIADAAGVNHGQIHHYFGSKDELIAATIQDGAARYHHERLEDGLRFPIPIDTANRTDGWRTLAYLASTGVWRQPPFEPSKVVGTLAQRRAEDLGSTPTNPHVLADVAAAMAMQRGWWIFRDIIETALADFAPDITAVRAQVAERSMRLFDEAIPLGPAAEETDLSPAPAPNGGAPRGPDEVKASLIGAAYELLADRNPSQVTTKEIASHAGVNHGQIHHYFSSKEHLIAQAIRYGSSALLQSIDDGTAAVPVPIRTTSRHPMWRTLAHIAATEEWANEAYGRAPAVIRMVEVVADRLGEPQTSTTVHAQVAAVHALELGWAVYRDIIEYGIDALGCDVLPVRDRRAAMSYRLVDDAARSGQGT